MVELPRHPHPLVTTLREMEQPRRAVLAIGLAALVVVGAIWGGPAAGPAGLIVVVVGAAAAAVLLGSPYLAMATLLVASFTRLAVPQLGLPSEPMVLVLYALVAAVVLAVARGALRVHVGALELAMAAYLLWNVVSALVPHELPAVVPTTGDPISVARFVLSGTVLPFLAYVVARAVLRDPARVRHLLIGIVVLATYSAIVSILQFTGPAGLVWPRYVVNSPTYAERAVGVVNQPAVNGMLMVVGFVTAMFLAQRRGLGRLTRVAMLLAALLCLPGIYLTKTRAVWLVFAISLVLCAVCAKGVRVGFVATLAAAAAAVGLNWATFTSTDREAGGVGSTSEVVDRLNSIATSMWAIEQKPLFGWGIGRFAQVNTYYHQQWAPSADYRRGYAYSSHENELGIATELGLVGLALWLAVLVLLVLAVLRAARRLPAGSPVGGDLGLIAVIGLGLWVVTGFTADLRFFDFANMITFVLAGAAAGLAHGAAGEG